MTITLEAIDVLTQAMEDAGVSCSARQLNDILHHLRRYGHAVRETPRQAAAVSASDTNTPMPLELPDTWPPMGVVQKLWAEINPGVLEEITDVIGLRAAKGIGSKIFEAATLAHAESHARHRDVLYNAHFTFDGENFDYLSDEIPF